MGGAQGAMGKLAAETPGSSGVGSTKPLPPPSFIHTSHLVRSQPSQAGTGGHRGPGRAPAAAACVVLLVLVRQHKRRLRIPPNACPRVLLCSAAVQRPISGRAVAVAAAARAVAMGARTARSRRGPELLENRARVSLELGARHGECGAAMAHLLDGGVRWGQER